MLSSARFNVAPPVRPLVYRTLQLFLDNLQLLAKCAFSYLRGGCPGSRRLGLIHVSTLLLVYSASGLKVLTRFTISIYTGFFRRGFSSKIAISRKA